MKCAYCEELFVNEGYQCHGMMVRNIIKKFHSFFFTKIHVLLSILDCKLTFVRNATQKLSQDAFPNQMPNW